MTKNIIALSFIFLIKISFSQSKSDIAFFQNLNKEVQLINYNVQKDKKASYGFFSFYKRFISSQDSGNCNFYPSCSVFEHNLFKNSVYLKASLILLIGLIGVME